ncbi:MAG: CBS and ACT domain-containing protein [candidate division NC10 bacterium]|nr:CBS and ACT domain-containing protein [candidate division NC10 bacterium]
MNLMTVGKVMSARPVVVEPKAPLREVCRLMAEHRIRHVPVISADGLVGVISDRDVREALPSPIGPDGAAEYAAAMDHIAVWKVMAEQVITVTPRTPLAQAAHLLADRKIGCLPVIEAGRLVGIVTETDVLRAFAVFLDDLSGTPRLEVAVRDIPGRLGEISRLFTEVPPEVGSFMGAWTDPAHAADGILVLRFQAFEPQEILRILERAGIEVLHPAEGKV